MANTQDKFSAGDVTAGINTKSGDFTSDFQLDPETRNLTTGINQGQGPRYGMSPIPAHSNKDQVELVATVSQQRGLRASEQTGNEAEVFVARQKFLGIVPLAIGSYDDLTLKGNEFLWLISDFEDASTHALSAVANSEYDDTAQPFFTYKFDVGYGFTNNLWAQMADPGFGVMTQYLSPLISRLAAPSNTSPVLSAEDWTRQYLGINEDVFYCSSAVIAVSGNKWPQKWMHGEAITVATTSTTADANFTRGTISTDTYPLGVSPSWNIGDYKKNNRDLAFWNMRLITDGINTGIRLMRHYVYSNYPVDVGTFLPAFNQVVTTPNYALNGTAAIQIANNDATVFNGTMARVTLNDPDGFCDSSYRIVLVAAKKPLGYFIQDWQRDVLGRNVQLAPLTDRLLKPKTVSTLSFPVTTPTYYTEDGVQKSTCFNNWPTYDSAGALGAYPAAVVWSPPPNRHVTLSAVAGSGVLRANTSYEFTYSIFDKQLGIETNVGEPAKIKTSTVDNIAISLYIDGKKSAGAGVFLQYLPSTVAGIPIQDDNWSIGTQNVNWANFLELRFYYRIVGSNEWLPALFIDAVKYWYYPDNRVVWACEGNVAGLPGGQPGGFSDYSYLPDDQYTCVVNYKNRAFWFSQNNSVFSLRNNPFAYPLRNSAAAPTGGFRGAIVHTYRGQSEQQSRLIIFGQKETYIGKFTGLPQVMPVVVSPNTVAEFAVDGSDFNVETWTSITSFSHRSAVVADGDLYWWGPEGIFIDNGVANPLRISGNLEPDIFTLYDEALIDEIHCVYDDKIKEIVWFYPPKDDNTITRTIRFNVSTQQFLFDEFNCKIDWAARVSTNNPGVFQQTNGLRTIASIRDTRAAVIQRGVFFDQINRSGDYQPTKELLVTAVSDTATPLQKVLLLDSGINAAVLGNNVALGDYIALQQFESYTTYPGVSDFIAKVLSVNTAAKTITIQLPAGTGLTAQPGLVTAQFFPVWHAKKLAVGLNGIPWELRTKYWTPLGPNYFGIFNYIYMLFKYLPWLKIDPTTFALSYKTPSTNQNAFISDIIPWSNNSDFNSQIFHALRPGNSGLSSGPFGNNQGQALKFALSGVHIGEEWVLQYLEMQADMQAGNLLKQYQA